MYLLNKGREPHSLTLYRKQPDAVYADAEKRVKDDIRKSLLNEQGYTCAYCMQRIHIDNMKVEHWECQVRHPAKQLTYSNLLACCKGNEGFRQKEQTCDTRKGSLDLRYSPAIVEHRIVDKINYTAGGTIKSPETDFDSELNDVLNLNQTRLRSNRRTAILWIQKELNSSEGTRNKESIRKLLHRTEKRGQDNKFTPFYGAMIDYLTSKL